MKRFFKEQLFPVVMIIIGAACAAFSSECFLIPNTILDGGVTGVSMMISYLSGIRLSILVIVINIPFFFVGYKALGKSFLLRAVIAMAAFSGFLEVCKLIPTVTSAERIHGSDHIHYKHFYLHNRRHSLRLGQGDALASDLFHHLQAYRHRAGGHGAGQGRDDNNRPRKRHC